MPRKAKHPCHHPGCPKLTEGRFCEEHQREENKRYEKYGRDLLQGNDTDVRGNASVTAMLRHIRSVSCAMRRECLSLLKRFTTRFLCRKVELMTGPILSLCASRATHGFMQREVTDGTEERVIRMNDGRASQI